MDIGHAPRHLGLRVSGADRALCHDELRSAATPEDDAVVGVLAKDLEPERVTVEGAGGIQVLREQNREHGVVAEHGRVLCGDWAERSQLRSRACWDRALATAWLKPVRP